MIPTGFRAPLEFLTGFAFHYIISLFVWQEMKWPLFSGLTDAKKASLMEIDR